MEEDIQHINNYVESPEDFHHQSYTETPEASVNSSMSEAPEQNNPSTVTEVTPPQNDQPSRDNHIHDGDQTVQNNLSVGGVLRAKRIVHPWGCLFHSLENLKAEFPLPSPGMWALVGSTYPFDIYRCKYTGEWELVKQYSFEFQISTYLSENEYATRQWVVGQGYLKSADLANYATRKWVTEQIGSIALPEMPDVDLTALNSKVNISDLTTLLVPIDASGNELPWSQAAVASAIKAKKNFLGAGEITATANGSGSGSGGGSGSSPVLANLGDLLDVNVAGAENGQMLVYSNGKWVNSPVPDSLDTAALADYLSTHNYITSSALANYATKTWVQQQGYLTGLPSHSHPDYALKTEIPSLAGYATQTWVENKGYLTSLPTHSHAEYLTDHQDISHLLPKATFDSMFELITEANGHTYIKAKHDFLGIGEITATANGSGSGSGGGSGSSPVLANLGDLLDVNVAGASNGQMLVYRNGYWVAEPQQGGLDESALASYLSTHNYITSSALAGYATQQWVLDKGYLTALPAHNHDTLYAAINHNHNSAYAAIGHNHDTVYAALNHTHSQYLTAHQSLANYVTLDTEQVNISGHKTFTNVNTDFTVRVSVNGATTNYASYPELMLHIPGINYAKLKMDSGGMVYVLNGGDTNWSSFKSIKALSFIKSGGTAAQFLKADGSVDGTVYLAKTTFDTMFELVTESNGHKYIKAKFDFLGTGEITATAGGSGGSGSGGGSASGTAYLADLLDVNLGTLKNGDSLVYYNGKWTNAYVESLDTVALQSYLTQNGYVTNTHTHSSILDAGDGRTLKFNYSTAALGYDAFTWVAVWNGATLQCCNKNVFATAGHTHSQYLTSHQSLANYVDKTSAQEISGAKTFALGSWILKSVEADEIKDVTYGNGTIEQGSPSTTSAIRRGIDFRWYDSHWIIGNVRSDSMASHGFGIGLLNSNNKLDLGLRVAKHGIYAQSFVKNGGTPAQFLKADGSVDGNAYSLTSHNHDAVYVKKAGDTMTGALTLPYNGLIVNSDGGDTATRILKAYGAGNNNNHYLNFGNAPAAGNCGELCYTYAGDASNSNAVKLGFYGGRYLQFTYGGDLHIGSSGAWKKVWNENNDGPGSGLDADLLDGYHINNYQTGGWTSLTSYAYDSTNGMRFYSHKLFTLSGVNCVVRFRVTHDINYPSYSEWILRVNQDGDYAKCVTLTPTAVNYNFLTVHIDSSYNVWVQANAQWGCTFQYRVESGTLPTVSQSVIGVPSGVIQTITNCGNSRNGAVYCGLTFQANAQSATKLQTTRTIWGQNFNGEGNVSGAMSGVTDINTAAAPAGTVYMSNWFRSTGTTGWYNQTYGGGIYMDSTNWVKTYNKPLYIANTIADGSSGFGVGLRCYSASHTSIEVQGGNYTMGLGCHSNGSWYWWRGTNGVVAANKSYVMTFDGTTWSFTGNILSSAEITATNTSDIHLKENVVPLSNATELLRSLGGYYSFDYKPWAVESEHKGRIGLIWQNVGGHFAELMAMKREDGYGALNYIKPDYINLIGAATLENANKIESLELRIKNLECEIKELNAQLERRRA